MESLRARGQDVVSLSKRVIDPVTGFLTAPARIATTGIQVYTARDIGLEGKSDEHGRPMPGDRVLRLLRAEDAVFDPTSMQSFEGAPVTFKHPPRLQNVDATNWRLFSVGDQYGVGRDGDYLAVQKLTIRDAAAVKAVDVDGTSELSCGYDFDVVLTPGRTADGREYDGRMTNIRGNHTAIVDRGRAGPGCRVADEDDQKQGARRMATITRPIDGVNVELDPQTMSIIERALLDRDKQITTLGSARDTAVARATTAEAEIVTLKTAATTAATAHDAKVKELEGKVQTQEAFDLAVEGRLLLITDALRVHDSLQPAGKSNDLIVTEVLTAVVARDEDVKGAVTAFLGGQEIAKAAPAARAAAFRAAVAMTKRRAQDGAGSGGEGGGNGGGQGGGDGRDARGNDSIRRAFDAALVPESPGGGGGGTGMARDGGPRREGEVRESNAATGRDEYIERTTTSWRQPVEQPGIKARDGAAQ